jgi:N-acetyl-alpha-D-muramate 1-phosphate uridylyltransferase
VLMSYTVSTGRFCAALGGTLLQALPLLGNQFFVLYGDSYLDTCFGPILLASERSGAPALMAVFRNDGRFDGVV